MLLLRILGVLLLLFLLVCLLRVRILVEAGQTFTLIFRIGPLKRQLYPAVKKKRPERTKTAKKAGNRLL